MKTISKTTMAAASVNAVFPSFKEIVNDPKYGISIFENMPWATREILHAKIFVEEIDSQETREIIYAEAIATLVNFMVDQITGKEFYTHYDMNGEDGECEVLDSEGKSYTLNPKEFFAILKIFWFSYMGIPFSNEQREAYYDFKSDPKIFKIMD
jgi:hypothetical protein